MKAADLVVDYYHEVVFVCLTISSFVFATPKSKPKRFDKRFQSVQLQDAPGLSAYAKFAYLLAIYWFQVLYFTLIDPVFQVAIISFGNLFETWEMVSNIKNASLIETDTMRTFVLRKTRENALLPQFI